MRHLPAHAGAASERDRLVVTGDARATAAPVVPDPRRWHALWVLMLALFMDLLDGNVVNVAIPSLREELGMTAAQLQWVPAAYMLSFGVLLVPGGRLGDIVGRKRMFLVGALGFVLGSAVCALAWDAEAMVAARAVQGAFAAVMVPQVLAIIRVAFAEEFAKVVGISAVIAGVAVVSGPLVGGLLVEADLFGLGWRGVFAVNVPVGALTVVLAGRWVRESRAPGVRRLDLAGVGLAVLALLLLLVPLVQGRELGWPLWSVASVVLFVPALVLFVRHQRSRGRRGLPQLVVLDLFASRAFSAGLAVQLLFQGLPAAFFLVWTLYVQVGMGWTALDTGLASIPFSVAVAVSGGVSVQFVYPRLGRMTLLLGVLLTIAGLVVFGVVAREGGTRVDALAMALPLALIGLGVGQVLSPLTGLILSFVPVRHAGSASGLVGATGQVGAALGVVLVGLVFFGSTTGYAAAFERALWLLVGLMAAVALLLCALPGPIRSGAPPSADPVTTTR
ncbi:MFS transporter [Saccharothrix yanglingensis]|uniref:MFS transporter n=1 Tax=Saccharothrix yanglingensis TaxID=659496 RepID=A0ABU0XE08_9PSEU|nr:MFS transporter [Saccharothrix yanglingensis]